MEKIWKSIKGFNGYKISNYGVVYSEKTKKQLSLIKSKDGYLTTTLYLNGKGYKFYIMDSGRGHDGPYKSVADANRVVEGSLNFLAIIKP